MNKTDFGVKMTCIGKLIEKKDGAIKNALTKINNINQSPALILMSKHY